MNFPKKVIFENKLFHGGSETCHVLFEWPLYVAFYAFAYGVFNFVS